MTPITTLRVCLAGLWKWAKKPKMARQKVYPMIAKAGSFDVLGVTLSWGARPVVYYRFKSGETGYLPKAVDPWKHFDERGWPLMEDGSKMPIFDP